MKTDRAMMWWMLPKKRLFSFPSNHGGQSVSLIYNIFYRMRNTFPRGGLRCFVGERKQERERERGII